MTSPIKENPKPSSSECTAARSRLPEPASLRSNDSTSWRSSKSPWQFSSSSVARWFGSHSEARWNNSSICAQRSGVKGHLATLHFALQPRFRHLQVAPNGNHGHIQRLSDLVEGEPAKIAKLHSLAFPCIDLLECTEADIECKEVHGPLLLKTEPLV